MTFDAIIFFTAAYGIPLSMILFAWAMEPKPSKGNSGVRL
jgi:hypothetical protein